MAKPDKGKPEKEEKVAPPTAPEVKLDLERLKMDELLTELTADDLAYIRGVGVAADSLRRTLDEGDQKKRADLLKQYGYETDVLIEEQRRIAAITDPRQREAELARHRQTAEELKKKAEALEAEAQTYKAPETYDAMRRIRETALKKFKDLATDNWSELVGFFIDALHDRDVPKADAIFRKLTNDGNENELTNWMGYPSTIQGMHDFVNEVLIGRRQKRDAQGRRMYDDSGDPVFEKIHHLPNDPALEPLRMNEQEALAMESDISYAAEKGGHWEVARVIKRDVTGKFVQMSEEEHAHECTIEIGKMRDPRAIARGLNRLAYGGEMFDIKNLADYRRGELERDFTLSLLGLSILATYGDLLESRWDVEVNLNLKIKLKEFIERDPEKHIQLIRESGVPEKLITKMKGVEAKENIPTNIGAVVKRAMELRERLGLAPQ